MTMISGNFSVKHTVSLTPHELVVDGLQVGTASQQGSFLSDLYHKANIDYPKFFKMDALCKAGFIASEALLQKENDIRFENRSDRAVLLFNKKSSLAADTAFAATIANKDDFYPKPSLFVYTLPNIVTGEISIRNKYLGPTEMVILPDKDYGVISKAVERLFCDVDLKSAIVGWVDAENDSDFEVELYIVEK